MLLDVTVLRVKEYGLPELEERETTFNLAGLPVESLQRVRDGVTRMKLGDGRDSYYLIKMEYDELRERLSDYLNAEKLGL